MKSLSQILLLLLLVSCGSDQKNQLIEDLQIISSDEFEGRGPGTNGSQKAQKYVVKRLQQMKVDLINDSYLDTFDLKFQKINRQGANIQALKKGNIKSDKMIVVSAHYDHLGIKENQIFNGANDNATGVSVLLNLISSLKNYQTNHSLVFLFFDAEEFGKQGVKHFLGGNPELHDKILLNFNLDMLNCNHLEELYICGTNHNPEFRKVLEKKVGEFNINFGHDGLDQNKKSWLRSSDHREFADLGIPFIYLGSENEENYNTPQDDFENINIDCFIKTLNIARTLLLELDQNLN